MYNIATYIASTRHIHSMAEPDRKTSLTDSDARWPETYHRADDEISLFDLWLILVRRLWLMIFVFVGVVGLGLAYALLQPAQHSFSAAVEIGEIPRGTESEQIESSEAVLTRLNSVILPEERHALIDELGESGRAYRVSTEMNGRVLTLSAEGSADSTDIYRGMMASAMGALVEAHEERIADIRERIERALTNVSEQIDEVSEAQSDDFPWEVLCGLRGGQAELESQRDLLSGTRVVAEPSRSIEQTGTSGKLILALSIVLGGMLAIFAAFFVEFVIRANEYARARSG